MEGLEALGETTVLATYKDRIIYDSATNLGPEQWLRQITPCSQS